MIKINNLSFAYGENIIFDKFSLEINDRLAFLMGKNGAGKTTLLKLIHGDLKDYSGEIVSYEAYMLSQSFMLFDELSAIENISSAINVSKKEVESLVSTSPFYIDGLERKVKDMTTIERQTVELIAMSLTEKKLILLDEASAALDARTTEKLKAYIKSSEKSFLMVSHNEDFIQSFDAKEILLDKQNINAEQKNESDQKSHNKKIIGIYLKDEAKLEILIKGFTCFAYVPKDVRSALLMDEEAYKNIFIYDILKNKKRDYLKEAEDFIAKYKLKFKASDITKTLSGGNLQKLVFFREIERDEDLYILYNYKKGMDFEAKSLAQKEIIKRRDEGKTIYIVSDDYEDLKEDIVDEIKVI
jgi:ABC-type uncharacterized transport system ATPase subunit